MPYNKILIFLADTNNIQYAFPVFLCYIKILDLHALHINAIQFVLILQWFSIRA